MSNSDYHLERARQCRDMAERTPDEAIRRLHEELAVLHSAQAEAAAATATD